MHPKNTILFDLDGTLLDSAPDITLALNKALMNGSAFSTLASNSLSDKAITVASDMQRALAILGLCSITPISPKTSFSPIIKFGSLVSLVGKNNPTSPKLNRSPQQYLFNPKITQHICV